jgi:hypothetical protein
MSNTKVGDVLSSLNFPIKVASNIIQLVKEASSREKNHIEAFFSNV